MLSMLKIMLYALVLLLSACKARGGAAASGVPEHTISFYLQLLSCTEN